MAVAVAAMFGICAAIAFSYLAQALGTPDLARDESWAMELPKLDRDERDFTGRLLASMALGADLRTQEPALQHNWQELQNGLATLCQRAPADQRLIEGVEAICQRARQLAAPADQWLRNLQSSGQAPDRTLLSGMLSLGTLVKHAGAAAMERSEEVSRQYSDRYAAMLAVLGASTLGFVATGLILTAMLLRTSFLYRRQLVDARVNRRRLQETIEALPAGVVLYDGNERLVMFNSKAAEISPLLKDKTAVGRTYEEIARLRFAGEGTPEEAELAIARFRQRETPGIRRLPDGRWIEWVERPTESGNVVGLRVDVTELKRAQLVATEAREAFESVVDSLSDVVFTADYRSGLILYLSAAASALYGLPVEDMTGRPFLDFVVPADHKTIRNAVRKARTSPGKLVDVQFQIVSAAGSLRHVEVRFRRLDGMAPHLSVTGVIRDITDRVELARRFNREVERLRSIVASSGAVIALTDSDLVVQLVNREFEKLHGVTEADIVGRRFDSVPDMALDRAVLDEWQKLPLPSVQPYSYQAQVTDPDGEQHRMLMTATPILDEENRVRQIVFLGVDDTERHEAELVMYQSERFALVGEMAATVAHELVQPLQVIEVIRAGMAEEIQPETTSPDRSYLAESLESIGRQIERANRIVGDLRGFVRGYDYYDRVPFSPVEAARAAIGLTGQARRGHGVDVLLDADDRLPDVLGHPTRMEQVFVNLLNNAIDAEARTIRITISAMIEPSNRDSGTVSICIADDGPGIPAEVMPRLFKQFVTGKPFGKGTGLGLRTCARILREMGGTIVVENGRQGGALFTVTLPAAAPQAAAVS